MLMKLRMQATHTAKQTEQIMKGCRYERNAKKKIEKNISNRTEVIFIVKYEVRTNLIMVCNAAKKKTKNIENDYVHHGPGALLRINCFVQTITSSWK